MDMLEVLLIEDDEVDAENIQRILSRCRLSGKGGGLGAKIVHVNYFDKALAVLKENKSIDIALLDLHLPDGCGPELVRRLKKEHGQVPVVVLTGQDPDDTLGVELILEGAQDYMPKNYATESSLARSIQYSINRHQLINKIRAQSQELKFVNEELETFTYIASHDLRSPLVNLKGFATELSRSINVILPIVKGNLLSLTDAEKSILIKECDERIPTAVKFISNSADKMDRLTGAILQLSRLGRREMFFEEMDVQQILEQNIKALNHQIMERNCQVKIMEIPSVIADKASIEQIFGNLLDNAIKYLEPMRPGRIEISAIEDEVCTTFTVKDNGRGIAKDDMHKVFEIFRRAGDVSKIQGEGMGMPHVRSLVKRHNGVIWCDSELGKGTSFHFTIARNLANSCEVI